MAQKNNVKILSVSKVRPLWSATATATPTPFTLPLTYFDNLYLKFPPSERLFFYQIPGLTLDSFDSVVVQKLKHSLSLTLLHYLPLAGHIMWPNDAARPSIYYFPDELDDGVAVTVAESGADFSHLSSSGIREAVEFYQLKPQLCVSDDKAAVVTIQITLFPNEGFCISVLTHHTVFDGKSLSMFVKSWAYLCKQLLHKPSLNVLPAELTPCFDRTLIKDPKGLDVVYANHWMEALSGGTRSLKLISSPVPKCDSNVMVRKSFELSREEIDKVRNVVHLLQLKGELHLSSYVLTCAYVFVCLLKALGEDEGNADVVLSVVVDCRSRLDPPLPVNYFGSCISGIVKTVKACDLLEGNNGIAFVAEKLSDMVMGLNKEVSEGSEEKIVNTKYAEMGQRGWWWSTGKSSFGVRVKSF